MHRTFNYIFVLNLVVSLLFACNSSTKKASEKNQPEVADLSMAQDELSEVVLSIPISACSATWQTGWALQVRFLLWPGPTG